MDKLAITVRRAIPEDAAAIKDIKACCLQKVSSSYYSEKVINKWMSMLTPDHYIPKIKSHYWFLVATVPHEEGERVVGYGYLNNNLRQNVPLIPEEHNCRLQVELLYVDVHYHQHGIGRKLMQELEKIALENECTRIGVLSSLSGVPFYSRLGYSTVETSLHFDLAQQTFTQEECCSIETKVMYKDLAA